ncbi:ABC transporter permease [Rhizobium ruizarguesonis]|jgi:NitT/TauT family transport system permease protein|uniref:ABC transporter permease n=1 Tax=Rhizobium ruizarguesonis TaxID=2081791 RepID=UPI0003795CC2|nr:ABC transporter permease [Rhizobium ruizarguesonis]TAY85835.1 ABC transporter permease [Rhizobium ruizarguesonis]TAZ70200.1 ABC transporter permease [Rhizobium ruizarguesonis]TAZ92736.1 ABC transporter permease [Rhizobium ruizarguesonis]TBA11364.1 ABC transporter permease [Rhizobium ruizarguesonis]TBA33891.1 ABC transporter permease [Rhizobium ruizarguesonis]
MSGEQNFEPAQRQTFLSSSTGLFAINIIAVVVGILLWAFLTSQGVVGLPTPLAVAKQAVIQAQNGLLWTDAISSLGRVFTGFALGIAVAIPIGFLMGWYRLARGIIEPYVQFFRTIPPLAIIPLAIVTMGIDETPKIFVIFLASFLSSIVATYQGVVNVDKTLINAARVLGASDFTIFRRVIVPASLPYIMVGVRVGLGSSWATVVAAELIAAQSGLGFRMQQAQLYYDLPTIFVSLIAIGVLGLVMDRIVQAIDGALTAWQEKL